MRSGTRLLVIFLLASGILVVCLVTLLVMREPAAGKPGYPTIANGPLPGPAMAPSPPPDPVTQAVSSQLVGSWHGADTSTLTFERDGSFEFFAANGNTIVGEYLMKQMQLTLFDDDKVFRYQLEFSETHLSIRADNGKTNEFERTT